LSVHAPVYSRVVANPEGKWTSLAGKLISFDSIKEGHEASTSKSVVSDTSIYHVKEAAALNECDPKMSESECNRKIEHDLDSTISSAVKNGQRKCTFEPTWRPTHSKETTLQVSEFDPTTTTIVVVVDGIKYTLRVGDYRYSVCQELGGRNCPRWKPEVGVDHYAMITNEPTYINDCLHRVLPAKRKVCIGFGKIKQETHPYGDTRTPEFEDCYSVPAY
jgi:hypothetical protein